MTTEQGVPTWACPEGNAHSWVIASPAGPTSRGECRKCGEVRENWRNSSDEAVWEAVKGKHGALGRWRSKATKSRSVKWNGQVT